LAACVICRQFLPPGFTEEIEGTNKHKCIFCIQGKDRILRHNKSTMEMSWDVKSEIVFDYKKMCNEIAHRSDVRQSFLSGIKE
jgi:hypothetical protein